MMSKCHCALQRKQNNAIHTYTIALNNKKKRNNRAVQMIIMLDFKIVDRNLSLDLNSKFTNIHNVDHCIIQITLLQNWTYSCLLSPFCTILSRTILLHLLFYPTLRERGCHLKFNYCAHSNIINSKTQNCALFNGIH